MRNVALIANFIPIWIFYFVAISTCYTYRKVARQPATLALWAYVAALLCSLANLIILFWIYSVDSNRGFAHQAGQWIGAVSIVSFITLGILIFAVFGWRKALPKPRYVGPTILVVMSVLVNVLCGVAQHYFAQRQMREPLLVDQGPTMFTGAVMWILQFLRVVGLSAMLGAIFGWRGYDLNAVSSAASTPGDTATKSTEQDEGRESLTGMFPADDYVAFLCGVMLFGGFLVVPLLWGLMTGVSFEDAIVPSLMSCGIFAFAWDKDGNFSFGRFFMALVIVGLTMLRVVAKSGGQFQKPVFIAGGFIGYLVMFGCGWAGIGIWRLVRQTIRI